MKFESTIRRAAQNYRARRRRAEPFADLCQSGWVVYLEWRGKIDALPEDEARAYLFTACNRRFLSDDGYFSADDRRKPSFLNFSREDSDERIVEERQRENRRIKRGEMRRFLLDALDRGRTPSSERTKEIVKRTLANDEPQEIARALGCDVKSVWNALVRFKSKVKRLQGESQ